MSKKTVDITELTSEIEKCLSDYIGDIEDSVVKRADECSKEAMQELKIAGEFKDRGTGGKYYRKGWTLRTQKGEHYYRRIVANKNKPSIVHLLEFGHGGIIKAKAYPHVRKIEEKYNAKFIKKLKEDCKR